MPGCLELATEMTGSTSSGPPQPPKDAAPKAEHHQLRGKMTPRPESGQPGQPMQLTPLWEHVVRTRRFPMSVDAESTFREISDRLRDPEWEVRQHALRVLVDVLPVLEQHVVDKLMVSVVPELVTNLGHPAPAVRKGALDTLRVYLCYSQDKENMFQKILDEGFNRPDALDNFQNNVSMGMILSVPSLLFPSAGSPRPPEGVLKFAVNGLASRLVQVTHQEAALRSLARIRGIIGGQEFDSHMLDYNANVKRDFEVLCEVYNVKIYQDKEDKSKGETKGEELKEIVPLIKEWSSDSDSSGATDDGRDEEEDQDDVLVGPMPPARVVLETEIKFDEDTAITMTILEEKEKESNGEESDSDSDFDPEDVGVVQVLEDAVTDRRKTRRRVRFGGEIVKLRTPDSDEASIGKPEIPRTKIPLPLFPATKMPLDHRRAFSQPTSPTHSKHPKKRSLSSSPKREIYTHNALLSPKKSILTRPSSPVYVIQPVKPRREGRKNRKKKTSSSSNGVPKNSTQLKQIKETSEADETSAKNSESKENDKVINVSVESVVLPEVKKETIKLVKNASDVQKFDVNEVSRDRDGDGESAKKSEEINTSKESPKRSSRPSSRVNFDVFPKQERNYILMELSSPERKKYAEKMSGLNELNNDFSPFGGAVSDPSFGTSISTPKTEMAVSDQLLTQIIDNVSTATGQTSGGSEATMIQRFPTTMKTDRSNTGDVVSKSVQELQGGKFHQDPRISSNLSTTLISRNLQTSKEIVGQFKGDVKVTSNATNKQDSESSVHVDIAGDKNRSFRELTSDTRNGSTLDESESLTCSSSEGEGYSQEPSWEELGLVDQETLNDLHNKDDWRSRVRGLERLGSALKTSSALTAVEPRLGSLLQAVLGGERSCRIAAAGMAVARVVISGVSEDALRRRLPQLAWGLTRQGGPHAAQLARIAMLRLRPALLLEQFLQPHCLGARNGKTRENALQLLIFSLVTFPSTEFKVQTVARRVAETVGDRRRRVRQAALDTLAVLGQIYETEEVLEAGEGAASGRHDSEAMKAAIRSRLARKSLPLVSADGLVVYGLQISPNVRIATGADVDWIVAGSGSLSPGSGRSRGQLIGLAARLDSASIYRSESARSNPWTERSDLIAVGIGVGTRDQPQPFAWQLVPAQNQDDQRPKEGAAWASEGRNFGTGISNAPSAIRPFYLRPQESLNTATGAGRQTLLLNKNGLVGGRNFIGSSSDDRLRLEEKLLKYSCSTSNNCLHNSIERDTRSNGEFPSKYTQSANDYLRQRFYEYCREKARIRNINPPSQEGTVNRSESRIPILHTRERGTHMKEGAVENLGRRGAGVGEGSRGGVILNEIPRRITPGSYTAADGGSFNKLESQETNVGYGSMYQRRRRLVERNAFQAVQVQPDVTNQFSFPSQRYGLNGPSRKLPEHIDRDPRTTRGRVDVPRESPTRRSAQRESALPEMGMMNYQTVGGSRGLSHSSEMRKRSKSRSQERHYDDETKPTPFNPKTSAARDTYGPIYQRRRRLIEGNAFLALQTTLNGTSYYPQQMQHYSQHASERISPPHVAERSSRGEAVRKSVQKLPDRDQGMTEIPTVNMHEIKIGRGALLSSETRLRRPRSRSEENRPERNNDNKITSFSPRNSAIRNIDKAVVDDEDYDTQRRASSRSSVYEIQSTSSRNSQYQVTRSVHDVIAYEGGSARPVSADSSNSNISVAESHNSEIRRLNNELQHSQDENQSSNSPASHNSRSSTPQSQSAAAFDVVPFRTVPSRRNSVNSYVISLSSKRSNLPDESIAVEITDEDSSSTDVEVDEHTDERSVQDKLSHDFENLNAGDDTDDTFESKLTRTRDSIRVPISSDESDFSRKISKESIRSTISLKKSADSPRSSQSFQQLVEDESVPSTRQYPVSGESRETVVSNHSIDRIPPRYEVSENDRRPRSVANSSPKSSNSFAETAPEIADEDGEAILSTVLPDDTGSIQSLGSRSFQELDRPELYSNSNSASMVRSSQSHSNEDIELDDGSQEDDAQSDHGRATPEMRNSKNSSRAPSAKDVTSVPQSTEILSPSKSSLGEIPQSRSAMDMPNIATSRTGQSLNKEISEPPKHQPSKVPRMKPKPRVNSIRANPRASQNVSKPSEKPKAVAQLCFTQLESKDWEVVAKGLKTLSQIARQNPEQLESFGPGTLGRVLGRHVRNLRSQVSRAACLAAGEVFVAQPKGIEQEIDDIAGALLHRTADTNKFLRADSNAALDRLAENISPNKTIAVIVYRGATHQNAVVRATTGRLLSDVVNRIGPDQAMTLPRDVRDKLLVTGAKLLIDGHLDARNYGKKMFRALSHCEGFQKALTDAVPDTTLRHIEKTLRTL